MTQADDDPSCPERPFLLVETDPPDDNAVVHQAGAAVSAVLTPARSGGRPCSCTVRLSEGTQEIQSLNKMYRGQNKPTNVLSFPTPDGPELTLLPRFPLGDILIARPVLEQEAAAKNIAAADHLRHLAVHGLLHLFGYDHEEDAEARVMEDAETRILATLGVADPYATPCTTTEETTPA